MFHKTLMMLAVTALATPAYSIEWAADLSDALTKAAAGDRTVLVDFTGSDWCKACIYLETNILESKEFEQAVGDRFVLVKMDYPRIPANVAKISPEERQRRQQMLERYGIQAFPTVLLMDAKGRAFACVESANRTTEEYVARLNKAQEIRIPRDKALAEAESATGMEKARILDSVLKDIPEIMLADYADLVEEIMVQDPEDKLGYKARKHHAEQLAAQRKDFAELMNSFRGRLQRDQIREDLDKMLEFLKREDLLPEIRQAAFIAVSDTCALRRDIHAMLEYKKKALEVDRSNPKIVRRLESDISYIQDVCIPAMEKEAAEKAAAEKDAK